MEANTFPPKKTAVVLFNLGGPDSLEAVSPFLFNLFSDPAILRVPQPLRFLLAKWITRQRLKEARGIYKQLGGRSPLVPNTLRQAESLQKRLGSHFRVFVCMRYWHPRAKQVARDVIAYHPDRIVLLPLYPQFSSTTSASSFKEWQREYPGRNIPIYKIESYPDHKGYISALTRLIHEQLSQVPPREKIRVLFSAHGLPERFIKQGDPYASQVNISVSAILASLNQPSLDYVVCYQSRVGPLRWLSPSTEEEIMKAGQEKRAVVLVPISFVSEHSETLYELDILYKNLAMQKGVPYFCRVPTVGNTPDFIAALSDLVLDRLESSLSLSEQSYPQLFNAL